MNELETDYMRENVQGNKHWVVENDQQNIGVVWVRKDGKVYFTPEPGETFHFSRKFIHNLVLDMNEKKLDNMNIDEPEKPEDTSCDEEESLEFFRRRDGSIWNYIKRVIGW